MKIRAQPKTRHKIPLYTTIYTTYFYNYIKIILSPQTYWGLLAHFILSIKLVLNHFIIIKT